MSYSAPIAQGVTSLKQAEIVEALISMETFNSVSE
jgi:hypothetical protein